MRFYFILLFYLITLSVSAQSKYDVNWIMGQQSEILFDFNSNPVDILLQQEVDSFLMGATNISVSDSSGQLVFYSNGCSIRDASHAIMQNGQNINPGLVENFYCNTGTFSSPVLQGGISLPLPGSSHIYYLFNLDLDIINYDTVTNLDPKRMFYQVIDMDMNNGLGAVVDKNNIAVEDSLALVRGQLQAVKHANGKDWWIMIPQAVSNCYHLLLLTAEGLEYSKLECVGAEWEVRHGIGQAVFSPDGNKYARINPWNGLHIFDFDRCEGTLSNPVIINFSQDSFQAAGVGISPNSRFLYATTRNKLYQFDLQADDISSSSLLIDTLDIQSFPSFGAVFYQAQLAPDGKIYISGISSHQYFHVINAPDNPGVACDLMQNSIDLAALSFSSIPNYPNYNLGASSEFCDSSVSTNTPFVITKKQWTIAPNPTNHSIIISSNEVFHSFENLDFKLFDLLGRNLLIKPLINERRINLSELSSGIYIYQISDKEKIYQSGKICIEN